MRNIRIRTIACINRHFINREKLKRKVFCIGLHKTGTTSIHEIAVKYGYKATHSTDWIFDSKKMEEFEFFCDGGSHFDNQNECDFESLFIHYSNSLFILQTRNARSWIISKLKHAGWTEQTTLELGDEKKICHNDWKYKSLLTIENLIRHKYNYEQKIFEFFIKNDPHRLLVIDITDKSTQARDLARLSAFLDLRSIYKITLPHKNKAKNRTGLSEEVLVFIDKTIAACESEIDQANDFGPQLIENVMLQN